MNFGMGRVPEHPLQRRQLMRELAALKVHQILRFDNNVTNTILSLTAGEQRVILPCLLADYKNKAIHNRALLEREHSNQAYFKRRAEIQENWGALPANDDVGHRPQMSDMEWNLHNLLHSSHPTEPIVHCNCAGTFCQNEHLTLQHLVTSDDLYERLLEAFDKYLVDPKPDPRNIASRHSVTKRP